MSIEHELAYAADPVRFARECLGFEADEWQARLMRSKSRQIAAACGRQVGKSTATAALATHSLLFGPGDGPVIISCPSQRQSVELLLKIQEFLAKLTPEPVLLEDNKLSLRLASGARCLALPGDSSTIRGISGPRLAVLDEAAFFPTDSVYTAIRPMLAVSQGKLILLSTPNGKRGFFHAVFDRALPNWELFRVRSEECPRITKETLDEERAALGDWLFRQEFEAIFTQNTDSVFDYNLVMSAMSPDIEPLFDSSQLALIRGI